MRGEKVLEDGKIGHGRIHHLLKVVICELGSDEVSVPELVIMAMVALVHLFLDITHGAVHGEWHAVTQDDGVVDDAL